MGSFNVFSGHLDIVKDLLKSRRADPNAFTKDGANVLYWASFYGRKEVVEYLIKYGTVEKQ